MAGNRELHYVIKDLTPAPSDVPGDSLPTVLGVHTRTSGEPERGQVEQWIHHLISLGDHAGLVSDDGGQQESGAA